MRLTAFIIYLLLCSKLELSIFWYDWTVFAGLSLFTFLGWTITEYKASVGKDKKIKFGREISD
tara:strand:- start:209 stop:397 length:189 start_codon:yes stop_codon:yes gene_type:complete